MSAISTQLAHGIKATTTTAGTGSVTLAALAGFMLPLARFAVGSLMSYSIQDGNNREWGIGTVQAGGVLDRTTITGTLVAGTYTTGGAALTLSGGQSLVECVEHEGSELTGVTQFVANASALPETGVAGKLYVAIDTGVIYRWTGSVYLVVGSGGGAGTSAEAYGAAPSATAAVNSQAIQDAVNIGGVVTLSAPGVYQIDKSILVGDDTAFMLGHGVTIKCVNTLSSTMFAPFLNSMHARANQSITSITGAEIGSAVGTGNQVMVTAVFAAPHNLVAPGYVFVNGDTNDVYNGVWKVHDLPNSTTVRWVMGRSSGSSTPPAGSGTLVGCRANGNVFVGGGGTIDSNFFAGGFTQSGTWNDHAIVINKCLRPHVEHLNIENTRKYGVQMGCVDHPVVRNITGNTRSDGVHCYGPAWSPLVENIFGTWGDDCVIFQPIDGPGYLTYQSVDQGGHIYNPTARNIQPKTNANSGCCLLYPNGGAGTQLNYKIFGTALFENIGTKSDQVGTWGGGVAFNLGGYYVTQPGFVDNIILRGVYGGINLGGGAVNANSMVTVNSLTIEGWNMHAEVAGNAYVSVDYMNIGNLVLRDCTPKNTNTNKCINLLSANATVKRLEFSGGKYDQNGAGTYSLVGSTGGTLGMAVFNGPVFGPGVHGINGATFANTPVLIFNAPRGEAGYQSLVTMGGSQSITVHLNAPVCDAASVGLFNLYGTGTYKITASGVQASGTLFTNLTGTATISCPDGTLTADLTKLARTAGQIVKTAGAYGTIPAGVLAVCDNSGAGNSWKALHNTALVY